MYTIKGIIALSLMRLFSLLPLQDKAVFISFDGKIYGDNPQVIFEEMKKQCSVSDYIWLMRDSDVHIEGAETVKAYSVLSIYHLATAKLWISCSRLSREWIYKRKGQYYVQTWHGDVCIKKIEKDAEEKLPQIYVRAAKHDSEIADLMISGSKFRTDNYRSSFWYNGEILELGTPKADIFYKDKSEYIEKVRKFFGLKKTTKIALYVPTFRDNGNTDSYNLDYERLYDTLTEKFSGEWCIFVRMHPNVSELHNRIQYNDKIKNATGYNSTNELILASNIIITDYSACMFDGLEADIPVFLYASDISDYSKERGTYFELEKLPFPLAVNNDEMVKNILTFDMRSYKQGTERLKNEIGYFNNADSAKKVTEEILKRVGWTKK